MIVIKGLIIGGGELLEKSLLEELIAKSDIVIAADGAGKYLYDIDVIPDLLVGDFDTLSEEMLEYYNNTDTLVHKFPPEKDKTDLELAIDFAIEHDVDELILTSVLGSRIDHSLGNIMLLFKLYEKGIKAKVVDGNNEVFVIDRETILKNNRYEYVSILPIIEDLIGVSLEGFEYETKDKNFYMYSTYGISNKLIKKKGIIKIESGRGLAILSKD